MLRLHAAGAIGASSDGETSVRLAVASVSFDYGGTRVGLADPIDRVLRATPSGLASVMRDSQAEREACVVLERHGAIDAACVEEIATDEACDYLVHPFGGASERCAFTATALGTFAEAGWRIEIAEGYPYQIVSDDRVVWDATIARADVRGSDRAASSDEPPPSSKPTEWFELDLGILVDGHRVDLLPVILDLVDGANDDDDLKSIARNLSGTVALPVSDTHHVRLPVDRFRALVAIVIELYQGVRRSRSKICFPAQRAPAIARLEAILRGAPVRATVKDPFGVAARGRSVLERPTAPALPELRATLRPYQESGVAFLQHLRDMETGGLLADDMGLGKTLQVIAHLAAEKKAGRLDVPALIVTPTSLAFNWAREIDRFAPHLSTLLLVGPRRASLYGSIRSHDIIIVTYPVLVRDTERLAEETFSSVVLDEAQAIKNARSERHRALDRITATHRICLSGTPVENDLGELWALFHFAEPGLLGTESSFKERFRVPIETRGDEARLAALREIVGPYILRRKKSEVAPELPEKTELFVPVEFGEAQRELYEQIRVAAHGDVRRAIRKKGLAASAITVLDAITKLRQVCCDPKLVKLDGARKVSRSAKLEGLFDLLAREIPAGHRALIFSQFTSMLALIAQGLETRGMGYVTLTGDTRDRRGVVDAFERGDADIFLISLKAGGTGLNLVSADTVIHYDPWWNPASEAQATDRAYRIGQTKPVFAHHLYVAGSVEERVLRLQRKKAWLAGALLGEAPSGPSDLSELDVERLLAPLDR